MTPITPPEMPPARHIKIVASGSNKGGSRITSFGKPRGANGTSAEHWLARAKKMCLGTAIAFSAWTYAQEAQDARWANEEVVAIQDQYARLRGLDEVITATASLAAFERAAEQRRETMQSIERNAYSSDAIAKYEARKQDLGNLASLAEYFTAALGVGTLIALGQSLRYSQREANTPKQTPETYGLLFLERNN